VLVESLTTPITTSLSQDPMTEAISHKNSFTMTALIRLSHKIKEVNANNVIRWSKEILPRRFFCVDNLVDLYVHALKSYHSDPSESIQHLKVCTTVNFAIKELAESLALFVGFRGEILWDENKSDVISRKQSDISNLLASGCQVNITLQQVINIIYNNFLCTYQQKSTV
jgi:GDP-L-fucose synthase